MRKQDTLTGHKSKQKHEQQTSYSTPTAPAEKRLGWPGKKAWRKWPPDLESLLESNWKIVLSVPSFRVAWGFPSGLHNPAPVTCFLQSFPLHDCPPLSSPPFQILRKRPWCWEKMKAKGEEDEREWDAWMTSLTQWTWAWANSGRQWWTEKPGVLQFTELQRVGHDLAT